MATETDSAGAAPPAPCFLVGSVRSGTTLLRLMLDHHPRIAFLFEAQFLVDRAGDDGGWPELSEYRHWLGVHRGFGQTGFEIDPQLDYPDLMRSFLDQKRARDGKDVVGATVHWHFDRLLHIWPDARFIHLVRDGRDVARSRIQRGWAGNGWVGVSTWVDVEELWDRTRDRLRAEQVFELRYEDFIADPEAHLRRLCDFMEVPYDAAMFDYAKTSTYAMPDPKLVQQWRRKAGEHEVRLIEARAASMLERRGYELSGSPRLEVGALGRAWLAVHNKLVRARFKIRKYGLRLYLSSAFSRRLSLQGWQRSVRLRMNEIDNKKLI